MGKSGGVGLAEVQAAFRADNRYGRFTQEAVGIAGFLSLADLQTITQVALRTVVIAGGAAGDHVVAGIAVADALRSVMALDIAEAAHLAVNIQAGMPIDAHPVHGHDITTVAAIGGGGALTEPAVAGAIETTAAGQVNAGAVDALAAEQDHAFGAGVVTPHVRTWAPNDLTVEFAITAPNTINNGGGTGTVGQILIVVYEDLTP